ncbi:MULTISPECIES: SDR family oxidoreductase [Pseudomonas]|uniref:SDR family oxidoreductase n=2 Tax=Pseudomonas TaxID=286 RepID=A0AAW6PG85_9PSED|nr:MULTISPECIES: SDR family oxidoreductase [Pseudomonas]VEE48355.1 short-chain alcohol dehydrogenase [Pseudomonas fluorescens]EIU4876484.1 SDR family oxidoreductase [Pseudomonas aeruginosa]KES20482.1 short-chain dehydrogenase [Pseudomonas sp. AAC]MBG5628536.1 SDR family oxidoreductase [Pseudomonas aeruginosa]MBH3432241.1 SDR family oxidoreductase [Pseudomonas citronellolis]
MPRERVLITGGASGIGAAIAQRCREDGFEPVIIDRIGDGLIADLSDTRATAAALEQVLADGPITRLVNNVGMVCPNPADEQSFEELERVWALNVRCSLQCMQALLPGMKAAGFGRILNMSSRAALGKELRSAYAATKAGLLGMTRVWALELGRHGITANAIGPGPIRTELFERANPPDSPRTRAIIDSVPVKRLGVPDDIAQAASFFLDARAGFVTGQVLYVCGGMTVGVAAV